MPFTFAHPAAILPLVDRRREVGWNEGLFMGALVPDLLRPLFAFDREFTHSLLGLAVLDAPTAVLLAWLVHRFISPRLHRFPGLGSLAPGPGRFSIPWSALAGVLGALSHLFWDLFTHDRSIFTRGGILDHPLFSTPAGPFRLGQASWYAHSLLGMALLLFWQLRRVRRSPGGIRSLASWKWVRILVLPSLPFLLLLRGFHPALDQELPRELFIHLAYMTGNMAQHIMVVSATIALAIFLLETRQSPANRAMEA